eukprot:scaffold4438_cov56-Cyclotella_meneghiniana.AAC.5
MTPRPPDRRRDGHPFGSRPTNHPQPQTAYFKPSSYTFTCRGGFHIQLPKDDANDSSVAKDLEAQLRDTYICNGIETKLKHVADYPLARSKEEAVRWFEGSNLASGLHASPSIDRHPTQAGSKKTTKDNPHENDLKDDETFSSYGTTQVNILTVQEIPVSPETQRKIMDPFASFGPLSPSGAMNPFGSLFGAFFGGGFDPWADSMDENDQHPVNNNRGWMRGSKSVSSSTRTSLDENGKRVATTVSKTTTVDNEGNRRVETETVTRYLDEGGRVERKKEIHDDSKKVLDDPIKDDKKTQSQTPPPPPASETQATPAPNQAPRPPEIAMIATDCRFGLAVTDAKMNSKDLTIHNQGDSSKWRKTEYLIKLGRLFPTLGVVSQYYDDKEQQEQKYNEQRQSEKKSRWDKSAERDATKEKPGTNFTPPLSFLDSSRIKYYLDLMGEHMGKNLNMMKTLTLEMTKPDFPRKTYHSGQKIIDNMGPTAERTGKLMNDVFNMWFSWVQGGEGR